MVERVQATPDSDPSVRVRGYVQSARTRIKARRWATAIMMLRLADIAGRRLPRTSRPIEELEAAWDRIVAEMERER